MANVIKCPACGESNLADQEFCQYCQTRLQPLTGNLRGADAPLKPGEFPTRKDTGELEPILPQWLRDARNSARQTTDESPANATQLPQEPSPSASSTGGDLLAGLRSQSQDDEEEDTPDWLASITGETPKTKKNQTESSDMRWVELGGANDFAQSESAPEDDTPAWLKGLSPLTPQPAEKDELTDWLQQANASQDAQQPVSPVSFDAPSSVPPAVETQDWLHSMVTDDGVFTDSESPAADEPFISSDAPDWLRGLDAENNSTRLDGSATSPAFSDTPDWLNAMTAQNDARNAGATPIDEDIPSAPSDVPDWLRAMDAPEKAQSADSAVFSETGLGESDAAGSSAADTPDWLKGFASSTPPSSESDQDWLKGFQTSESEPTAQDSAPAWMSAAPAFTPEPSDAVPAEIPGWLQSAAPEQEQPSAIPENDDSASDLPSWLKAAAPQSSIFDEPPAAQETQTAAISDTPDWLNAFKSVDTPEVEASPAFSANMPAASAPPASVDEAKPAAAEDALFTDMPDWLSIVDDTVSPESVPAPITNTDAIAPGDLPSWVQAMRPVDAGVPQSSPTLISGDRKTESRGALAGLQGVLPAVAGFSPTSKPKAYSIKMQASEEQQAHAALLEQILEAETAPVPIGSFSVLRTSRVLRWLLAFLFFGILTTALLMRTQIFSLPMGFPVEAVSALNIVRESIPQDSQVLVIFDYEPARTGEIEAVAVPMFDQMIRLHHPRLTFISANENGAILAEHLITSGPLVGVGYQSGSQYVNLGYLPGGQMGIRAFAGNPTVTAPYMFSQNSNLLDFSSTPAWTSPPLEGVNSLSQFAALILITDNADSARAWIEQTTPARGSVPFVVVSSAQAAPMIQPYYASKQISGLVSGLYSGALFEQNNEGRSDAVRRYWDAYSIGMLLAMTLILVGGLVSLALRLRDRATAREAK